jgi:hypothetical protein
MSAFTVGDRVAVYISGQRMTGTVHEELEFGNLKVRCDIGAPFGYPIVHPKQCRKLKKKARRRVWIHPEGFKAIPTDGTYQVAATRVDYSCNRWIEFIEVRKPKL